MNTITTTYNKYNQPIYNIQNHQEFKGTPLIPGPAIEKSARSVEFFGRKIVNKICDFFAPKQNNEIYNNLMTVKPESPEYIKAISLVSRLFSSKKEIEINLESNRIQKIAQSGKPHIFIMNHDNQSKDPRMLAFFNTLLNEEYLRTGQAQTCPRPKIILNRDILLSMNKNKRQIFEKIGAIPVDASIYSTDKKGNAKQLIKLIKGFINGDSNIFIFPEGKNAAFKYAPLKEKFQLGVAEIVTKLTDRLPEVNVTPIGFAYNKGYKTAGDSIYIGETVTFKKDANGTYASIGNVLSPHARNHYKKFFGNQNNTLITKNSIPVKGKEISEYIGGILCENLRICTEEAKAALPKSSPTILLEV